MCGVCGTRGVDAEPADLMGEKNLYQNVKIGNCICRKNVVRLWRQRERTTLYRMEEKHIGFKTDIQ